MSIINTKKELIDFLWDWAVPHGNWSQLLIDKITTKQTALDVSDREQIFKYYLQDIGFVFQPPLPPINITKPSFTPLTKNVSLTKLSEIKGVNCLAENQVIEFSPNLTVIYGNNGTGKTGYSRILKSQGYSFDTKIKILSDVKKDQKPQSAKIDYLADGNIEYIDWDGTRQKSDLNSISIFNSDCVNISLSNKRELLVSPQGFYLFQLVKNELDYLSQTNKETYLHYPITLSWKERLNQNTPQFNWINLLKYDSETKKLDELSEFKKQHETNLLKKQKEFKELNRPALESKLAKTNLIINELANVILAIKQNNLNFTNADWKNLISFNSLLKSLKAKTQSGLSTLAEKNGLELFASEEFSSFLKSADNYIKLIGKEKYPYNNNDTCIYCKQSLLDEQAKDLINSYSKILNDTTQSQIAKYTNSKSTIIEKIKLVNGNIEFHQPAFGINQQELVIQPKQILELNAKVNLFKSYVINDSVNETIDFSINFQHSIDFFKKHHDDYIIVRNIVSNQLKDLSTAELKLKNEIAELKDRKLLFDNKEAVKKCISNLYAHELLNNNKNKFNTDSLSRKTTEARDELISQDFQQKFTNELKRFRKQHLAIDISFYTSSGSSHINQKISNYNINDVLSEGEQKAIALAEFLTELQLDSTIAPVVFDDPVNSLDHHIIDDTARRIIELSRERQVVVFTHSILLFNDLYSMSLNNYPLYNDVNFKFYRVNKEFNLTGVLSDGLEINRITEPIGKLNVLFQNAGKDGRSEADITKEGYGHLRTALELLITDEILKKTVKRYRKNIVMSGFPKVNGILIEKNKEILNEIFERSSGFITGHSNLECLPLL